MTRTQLIGQIRDKRSYLCVGLDTDRSRIPPHLLTEEDPVFSFNRSIIDATREFCVAYKINTAFYEADGVAGWQSMEKTVRYIGDQHFKIADAKRGDIGNTSDQYARAFFETLPFDAVTVAPYMGEDSVKPFLQSPGKWAIVLALTSNAGARDFELQVIRSADQQQELTLDEVSAVMKAEHHERLYELVLKTVPAWGSTDNLMFVIGATQAAEFANIRRLTPEHFYLVPGVGAQGGSLREISETAMTTEVGLLVNASRAVIYASPRPDFAAVAANVARAYRDEMDGYLKARGL